MRNDRSIALGMTSFSKSSKNELESSQSRWERKGTMEDCSLFIILKKSLWEKKVFRADITDWCSVSLLHSGFITNNQSVPTVWCVCVWVDRPNTSRQGFFLLLLLFPTDQYWSATAFSTQPTLCIGFLLFLWKVVGKTLRLVGKNKKPPSSQAEMFLYCWQVGTVKDWQVVSSRVWFHCWTTMGDGNTTSECGQARFRWKMDMFWESRVPVTNLVRSWTVLFDNVRTPWSGCKRRPEASNP